MGIKNNAPAPEPDGYLSAPGFVKSNPDNNEHYLEQFKDDPWYPILARTHEKLALLIPGYNIVQIKEKFGGLRFYISLPEEVPVGKYTWNNTTEKVVARAYENIRYAEAWVDGYEHRRKGERNG